MRSHALSPQCCCIMYLHGNAEDLGLSHDLLKAFRDFLNVHVLGVEYPGYGPVPGNPCEGGVNRHTRAAFNFLTQKLRIPPQRIIVFGRSIGTGPATNLVSILHKQRKQAAALILQSPYRSIKTLAKELVGCMFQWMHACMQYVQACSMYVCMQACM